MSRLLGLELADLDVAGFDLDAHRLRRRELAGLLVDATAGLTDPDEVPDPYPSNPVSMPGDVWLLGRHRLVCGDCDRCRRRSRGASTASRRT